MNIFLPSNMGEAVFIGGHPYHRIGTSPVVVDNGAELTKPGDSDFTGLGAYTWGYDDSNVSGTGGTNHKTWTACEMAACYIHGNKDSASDQGPRAISASPFLTSYGGNTIRVDAAYADGYGNCFSTCIPSDIRVDQWVAPEEGLLRVYIHSYAEVGASYYRATNDASPSWTAGAQIRMQSWSFNGDPITHAGFFVGNATTPIWDVSVFRTGFSASFCTHLSQGDTVCFKALNDRLEIHGTGGYGERQTIDQGTHYRSSADSKCTVSWNGIFLPDKY